MTNINDLIIQLQGMFPNTDPLFIPTLVRLMELHSNKNYDYAKGGDTLGNPIRVAKFFSNYPNLKPSDPFVILIIYLMKQLDAVLWQKSEGYEGEVEGIGSKMDDIDVYSVMATILELRRSNNIKVKEKLNAINRQGEGSTK